MATESSAIARFVNQAQSHAIHDPYARGGVVDITQAVPPLSPPGPVPVSPLPPPRGPANPNRGGGLWLGLVGFVVIGGAVAGGYLLAQQQSGAPESEVTDAIGANAALAEEEPLEGADGLDDSAEPLTGAARTVEPDAAEDTINPDTDPGLAAREASEAGGLDLELAKKTGFDILVEPAGAKVSLDGHNIGLAPLRVRNLLPGVHGIDIEGPAGYFGKHLEFELEAGQAEVIELSLVAIDSGDSGKAKPVALAPEVEPIESVTTEKSTDRDSKKKTVSKSNSPKDTRNTKSKRVTRAQEKASKKASAAKAKKAMAGAGEVSLGTLMLGAKPPCQILIDGKNTGLTTPQRSIQLPEGTHRVVLVNDQHGIKKSFKVNIKAGRTTRAIQDLTKKL